MALNASKIKQESNFKRPPALEPGSYPARVVQIISLGLQEQRAFKGEPKPPKQEIYVTYELLDEFLLDEDGNEIEDKPRWISERIPMNPLDSDLATSTKRYYALDPKNEHKGYWAELIGYPCNVNIVNYKDKKDEIRDKVKDISTMRPKEAAKAKELVNPPKVFDVDEPDLEIYGSLPQWLQETMTEKNLDFEGSVFEKALEGYEPKDKEEKTEEDEQPDEDSEVDNQSNEDEPQEEEDW